MHWDEWGKPAYDENLEQDDVNADVSSYEDFLAREGDLWEGKSYAEALALSDELIAESSPHDYDDMDELDGDLAGEHDDDLW